jgi:hypothetical protein
VCDQIEDDVERSPTGEVLAAVVDGVVRADAAQEVELAWIDRYIWFRFYFVNNGMDFPGL